MEKEVRTAKDTLMEREAAMQREKENIITSAKSLMSESKVQDAIELFANHPSTELKNLLENHPLFPVCEVCGCRQKIFSTSFNLRLYRKIKYVITCHNCEEQRKKELEKREAVERREALLAQRARDITEFLRQCGAPRRYLAAQLSDFGNIKLPEEGLYLTGNRGTGKTHLAVAIMREVILSGSELPLFITVPDLLLAIRDTFDSRGGDSYGGDYSEKGLIKKYGDVSLLVLDDLGAEKTSEWSLQTLYTIIDRRYREELRTIITSNLTLDQVEKKLDDRIASRIAGMCKVQILKGKDRRIHGANALHSV